MYRICGSKTMMLVLSLAGILALSQQVPSTRNVRVVDVIPADMSGETNQDSEPFLSVDLADPTRMVVSAFTPDPKGGTSTSSPVFLTLDAGRTWVAKSSVPISVVSADITHAYVADGILQAGALKLTDLPGGPRPDLLELSAQDPALAGLMLIQETRENVDQPFVVSVARNNGTSVFIGENYLGGQTDATASVEVSSDSGAHFTQSLLETRAVDMQDGPSVRVAFARDGTSYAAYFGWRKFEPVDRQEGWITSDVIVARDDKGGLAATPFKDLNDDSDHLAGRIVAKNRRIHWSNKATLGQERTGSTLSLAVDPNVGSVVYVAWADNMAPNSEYTIHVQRSGSAGRSWKEIRQVKNATCVALAVADNGTLGLLYQQLNGAGASARWETHLEQTIDDFGTSKDFVLASTPADLPLQYLPYLGDYNFLLAVSKEFRGVFSANNFPDENNFPYGVTYLRRVDKHSHVLLDASGQAIAPSIDPFYFSAEVLENPSKKWSTASFLPGVTKPQSARTATSGTTRAQVEKAPEEKDLRARLKEADVVMVGHVLSTKDASQAFTFTNGTLSAVPEVRPRISEHDPDWKEAVLQVDRPLKGVDKDQKLVVRFPGSLDIIWRNYPKFRQGEEGLFLLKKSHAPGGGLQSLSDGRPLYAAPTKQDVLNQTELQNVIKLLLE